MKYLHMVSFALVITGALNWGLVGLFNFDLVMALFGTLSSLIYVLVAIAGLYLLVTHMSDCKVCGMTTKTRKKK